MQSIIIDKLIWEVVSVFGGTKEVVNGLVIQVLIPLY